MLSLERVVLHNVVGPVDAWETDGVLASAELLDHEVGEERSLIIVFAHLVVEEGIVIGASHLDHLGWRESGERCGDRDIALTLLTTFGSYEDNAVGTTDTEHGSGRGILKNGDALDFRRVDIVHIALYAIHLNERALTVGVEGTFTTDEDVGGIGARLSRVLHCGDARELTCQDVVDRGDRGAEEVFGLDGGDGTSDGNFLLRAVGNDFDFAELLRGVNECNGHAIDSREDLILVADEREFERGLGWTHDAKVAIEVGNGTISSTLDDNCDTRQWTLRISHLTLNGLVLSESHQTGQKRQETDRESSK